MQDIRAFILDYDGVIADTNPLHVQTWAELAREAGFPLENPDYIGKCGLRTRSVIRELLHWPVSDEEADRLGFRKEELFRSYVRKNGIPPIPGVLNFVRKAHERRIPLAIGSSAPPENISTCNEALGLTGLFDAIVSGNDVLHGKPAPDIFLLAAKHLDVSPTECLVFEDSPAGVKAARAAGMSVIGLLTSHTREQLALATQIVDHFENLDPASLCSLNQ